MSKLGKDQTREILKEYNVKTADDIRNSLKDMFGGILQEALEAELGLQSLAKSLKTQAKGATGTERKASVQTRGKSNFWCRETTPATSSRSW